MHYVTRSTTAALSVFKGSGEARATVRAGFVRGYYIALMCAILRTAILHVPHFARMASVPDDFSRSAYEGKPLYASHIFLFFSSFTRILWLDIP